MTNLNIFNIYISFCDSDTKIFRRILKKIIREPLVKVNLIIVHLIFDNHDKIEHIDNYTKDIQGELFLISESEFIAEPIFIKSISEIVDLFRININPGKNIFIYSGHSDGLIIGRKKAYIFLVEDFRDIIFETLNKKCDVVICDACLLGNISALEIFKDTARYLIASPNYYNYDSILEMKNLYKYPNSKSSLIIYCKRIMDEYIKLQSKTFNYKSFMASIVLYKMGPNVEKLTSMILKYKYRFGHECILSKKDDYYLDIRCEIENIPDEKDKILSKKYLEDIILYKCHFKISPQRENDLLIILIKPYEYINYRDNKFFKNQ